MQLASSVHSFCRVWLFATPWTATCQASLSITNSRSLLKLMFWVGGAIQSSHLLLLPSILPSIRVFSKESVLRIKWPKDWSFSFSIIPSNQYSELISFKIDWLDLLEVQQTLRSLLQHHSSKTSILWRSAFFTVQLSHPYMTTEKTIALTRWTWLFVTPYTAACQAPLSIWTLQARILEWVAMSSSKESSLPRDQIQVSHITSGFFTIWVTREAPVSFSWVFNNHCVLT